MSTFDALKKQWNDAQPSSSETKTINNEEMFAMIKKRSGKQLKGPIHYFWGAMVLHIILYAILTHIIVKYSNDARVVALGIVGILIYLPFTWLMVRKFKTLAILKPDQHNNTGSSLKEYVSRQKNIIQEFYSFKKKYELFLIPLSTALGTYLFFTIFMPGGVMAYWKGALFMFQVSLIVCVLAILYENRRQFDKPLRELQQIIDDFNEAE